MTRDVKKSSLRAKANSVREFRCKNLIAVLENPYDTHNIGAVIRNVNALGVEKVYVIDKYNSLPDDWQEMRETKALKKTSASAVKWTFVKRFNTTESCIDHLEKNGFKSVITSPHQQDKENYVLDDADFTEYTKLAVWFGSESEGISELAIERCAFCVSIPMFGIIESFNLGTTSGIVLYQVAKQRRAYMEMKKFEKNA
jgi:tRNA (guanosine-2'-O-)-methyltransferase